jgi:hypothetical protein
MTRPKPYMAPPVKCAHVDFSPLGPYLGGGILYMRVTPRNYPYD